MQNGTGNPVLMTGYEAAVNFFNTIGEDRWISIIKELGDYLCEGLKELEHVTILSSPHHQMATGIATHSQGNSWY